MKKPPKLVLCGKAVIEQADKGYHSGLPVDFSQPAKCYRRNMH